MSHVTFFLLFFLQSGEAYGWRVCYQRGLPRLVLKQRQEGMLRLVLKKLNLCSAMPASRGVNPLATSHTVEHLSSICLHSWSQNNLI